MIAQIIEIVVYFLESKVTCVACELVFVCSEDHSLILHHQVEI
jgi:hypothetical protein